ncbi:hypothetical protein KHA93_06590 [Bacillus sp. FJAT-49732]|uniref:Uncharacterized protein n=1 Tax=Lederbergia citrisecunda TaxID=2833583 RepID=A0A942TJP0_9BACI|nr:hypothetical protein [Lederbergia citrisecunda]MBS4199320.1 hypothetical protein [Lederbergia citrisecunda]
MRVPLSSYTVLKYIADSVDVAKRPNIFQSIEMEVALDSLKEYSVFAFIIHEPLVHHDFHAILQKQFKNCTIALENISYFSV